MKLKLNKESRHLLGDIIFEEPWWEDCCNHHPSSFVCSFVVSDGSRPFRHDLYLYREGTLTKVCIRYGSDQEEYLSLGDVQDFLMRTYSERRSGYHAPHAEAVAARILLDHGKLTYTLNTK